MQEVLEWFSNHNHLEMTVITMSTKQKVAKSAIDLLIEAIRTKSCNSKSAIGFSFVLDESNFHLRIEKF